MSWHGALLLWCAACAALALIGYGRSLAGTTRAQRAVRVPGRIAEVGTPPHGGDGRAGIPVTIAFPDPATGQEHVLPYVAGDRGIRLDTVWVGREPAVLHPPGDPGRFRIAYDLGDNRRGLAWPHFLVFLLYAGLVADTTIRYGYPWVLLGAGVPLAVVIVFFLRDDLRRACRDAARLDAAVAVPGRVVAVLTTDHDDGGSAWTSYAAVLTFTTRDNTVVTARFRIEPEERATAYGREVTVHYAPDAPEKYTLDVAVARRSNTWDIAFVLTCLLLGAAATVTGAVLL
ncbi:MULTISPECIES: DUF3592 domain-containing protein [unclassified Streptomyces]|uniref:DUF3592 domain-containing protein n=1 Tax=unclassified Streptomyces TaxID=2593676 RepID=UPI002E2A6F46|nr:DUF3592 domain-containing protein [Streptomyces sp. NBC_00223]